MEDNYSRFCITVWPGSRLPLPFIMGCPHYWDSTCQVLIADPLSPSRSVRVGGETYLELVELDLTDSDAILAFVNEYSALGAYEADSDAGWPLAANFRISDAATEQAADRLQAARSSAQHSVDADQWRLRTLSARGDLSPEEAQLALIASLHSQHAEDSEHIETREEFVQTAHLVRDAFHIWRAIREDAPVGAIHPESPNGTACLRHDDPTHAARTSLGPMTFLDWFFAQTMRPFQPGLRREQATAIRDNPPPLVVPGTDHSRPVRLYQACALELYNHIAANDKYKTCANESCQRPFVNQDGYTTRKHRDAKYHSRHCAKAQAQRNHRRRAAAARHEATTATTHRYRVHTTDGDDLGLITHPAPNLEPGDVIVLPDGREALITARAATTPGQVTAMLQVVLGAQP